MHNSVHVADYEINVSKLFSKSIDSFDNDIKTFFGLIFSDNQWRGQSYYVTVGRFGQQAVLH